MREPDTADSLEKLWTVSSMCFFFSFYYHFVDLIYFMDPLVFKIIENN